jgi:hypothetical protein
MYETLLEVFRLGEDVFHSSSLVENQHTTISEENTATALQQID